MDKRFLWSEIRSMEAWRRRQFVQFHNEIEERTRPQATNDPGKFL